MKHSLVDQKGLTTKSASDRLLGVFDIALFCIKHGEVFRHLEIRESMVVFYSWHGMLCANKCEFEITWYPANQQPWVTDKISKIRCTMTIWEIKYQLKISLSLGLFHSRHDLCRASKILVWSLCNMTLSKNVQLSTVTNPKSLTFVSIRLHFLHTATRQSTPR